MQMSIKSIEDVFVSRAMELFCSYVQLHDLIILELWKK